MPSFALRPSGATVFTLFQDETVQELIICTIIPPALSITQLYNCSLQLLNIFLPLIQDQGKPYCQKSPHIH